MEDQIVPEISLLRASKTRFTAYWRPCETFDQARYFRNTSRYFRNRITVQWARPAGYFRNAETVLRERLTFPDPRSEERSGGKGCVRTVKSRVARDHIKKKKN